MRSKKITLGLLIFYLLALTWIIVFKLQFSVENLSHLRNINLIPFHESVIVNGKIYLKEIIQNVLVFIPFGLLIHALWEQESLLKQFLPIISTSLLFEVLQFLFAVGASDITDIITNSLGGVIGIMIAVMLSKVSRRHWVKLINVAGFICAVVLTLFIAIIVWVNK